MFDDLTGSKRFRYETTVGSAVPVIEATLGLMRAADRIDSVQGALSGTLGFLCTGLQAGRPFSGLVARSDAGAATPSRTRASTWAGWMSRAKR